MFIKRTRPSTDPRMRSLLQKAVRRGNTEVVQRTVSYLHNVGDRAWLRSRAVVITFEECWPMAQNLRLTTHLDSRTASLQRVASASKQKDAAGLGALAHALAKGHRETLDLAPQQEAVRAVSEAMTRPQSFLDWAEANSPGLNATAVVAAARRYLPSATWPWDKACLLAAAYLATAGPIPECPDAASDDTEFPYWVALDKHTPQGKDALRQLARDRSIPYRHLIWASFYFESAKVNALLHSPWWIAERTWRLRQAGLSPESGLGLWEHVRSDFAARLAREAEQLHQDIESPTPSQPSLL